MSESAAVIIFDRKGQVLFLRRGPSDPWKPGHWNFPGGIVNPGETAIDAAVREVNEEAGIHLKRKNLHYSFTMVSQRIGHASAPVGATHIFWTKLPYTPKIRMRDGEHDAAIWGSLGSMPLPVLPGVQFVVQQTTGKPYWFGRSTNYGAEMYGRDYTIEELTVSAKAKSLGLSNEPATETHRANLKLLENFLKSLPFEFRLNSVYRSPAVNLAVKGSSSSQHMNALAVDLTPIGMTNKELATWLWIHREDYPELDQVMWYTDTSHNHIGICPPAAKDCVAGAPRGAFYKARSEGGPYPRWLPDEASKQEVLAMYKQTRPVRFKAATYLAIALGLGGLGGIGYAVWKRRTR